MSDKKKPARKTVTAVWVYVFRVMGRWYAEASTSKREAMRLLSLEAKDGTVGPITRIEVPLPEGK